MNIELILDRLEGVKRHGNQYMAKCPAHDDKTPSLSIKDAGDRILINCFSGCGTAEVVHALGLEMKDLFRDSGMSSSEKLIYHRLRNKKSYEDIYNEGMLIIRLARSQLDNGIQLNDADQISLNQAIRRVKAVRGIHP
jgi:putative DNA primase/helicase